MQKTAIDPILLNVGKSAKGHRYTHQQKILYLSDYKKSPAAFRWRQTNFKLPHESTLKRMLKKLPLDTGINPSIKDRLIAARKNMTDDLDSVCALVWDEMACSSHLDYDYENDRVCGFESWHGNVSNNIADHGLTFMLRGLLKGWKIPIAFGLCDGTTSSDELQK